MTSKQRAFLKGLAANIEPVLQIGKSCVTPELTNAVAETFNTRELVKLHILQNCTDDGREMAQVLAERTGSEVVQVIGSMIVLYKADKKNPKILLPGVKYPKERPTDTKKAVAKKPTTKR
ncbi:MAG: ribosome assembly RNA-binding protein YhbY [Lachnospiraceae bacterium]|nr:ribosome assembly RNA-binding protein YhbY [Lachnospiraceae bacterium]